MSRQLIAARKKGDQATPKDRSSTSMEKNTLEKRRRSSYKEDEKLTQCGMSKIGQGRRMGRRIVG